MDDEIPYPPRASARAPGRPSRELDWDAVRRRVAPRAARLVDGLRDATESEATGATEPARALEAFLAERLAALTAHFERARLGGREEA